MAATAQELPTVLQSVRLVSTKLSYDPLLVASFILAMTLAVGRNNQAKTKSKIVSKSI